MSPKAAKKAAPTPPRSIQVGDEVEAKCGKCKDITTHLVLAKIGWKPTRVECKVCSATHEFRSPQAAKRKTATTRSAPTLPPEEHWQAAMKHAKGNARAYDREESYVIGSRIRHPSFGEGVVTDLCSTTVCEVAFESGIKKLLMATRRTAHAG